jgi:hypothetical protein
MVKRNFAKKLRNKKLFSFATIIGFMLVIGCFLILNRGNIEELIHYYNLRNKEIGEINKLQSAIDRLEKEENDLQLSGFKNEKVIRDTQRWAKPGEKIMVIE